MKLSTVPELLDMLFIKGCIVTSDDDANELEDWCETDRKKLVVHLISIKEKIEEEFRSLLGIK